MSHDEVATLCTRGVFKQPYEPIESARRYIAYLRVRRDARLRLPPLAIKNSLFDLEPEAWRVEARWQRLMEAIDQRLSEIPAALSKRLPGLARPEVGMIETEIRRALASISGSEARPRGEHDRRRAAH